MKQGMYFGGLPTEPDIKKLRDAFPDDALEPGRIIEYSDVAKVIGESVGSNRFKTITSRWRRLVENETGSIVIGTEPGQGFKILEEHEKLNLSGNKLMTAARCARRSYQVTGRVTVKNLSEEDRNRMLTLQKRSAALIATVQIKRTSELPTLEDK